MEVLYTAMSGAQQTLTAQQIRSNNLANVNTNGFRADFERAAAYQVKGFGHQTRFMAQPEPAGTSFTPGTLQETGRELDIAIRGEGFISVITPSGREAYTRAGNMMINEEGLVTINGNPVSSEGGELILPEYQDIEIGNDGSITVTPLGGGATLEAGQIKLTRPDNTELTKGTDGLFYINGNAEAAQDDDVLLVSGYLEGSNVNAVNELVTSMSLSRHFEMQVKMMKTADQLAQSGKKLIGGRG